MSAAGEVLTPLEESDVERAVLELSQAGVRAVAVCFLHAYRIPDTSAARAP